MAKSPRLEEVVLSLEPRRQPRLFCESSQLRKQCEIPQWSQVRPVPLGAELHLVVDANRVDYDPVDAKPLPQGNGHNVQCLLGV